uniref:Putative 17-beta-hydroxysteroid dehydrogenase 13-like protein n=1 Tax=Lutzomyia longipalpis TaxID=7200 RepID=A0A1B0CHU5_LUTLO
MDVSRVFSSETTNYIPSEAKGITAWVRWRLIVIHFSMFSVSCIIGFLRTICGIFHRRWKAKDLSGKVALVTGGANGLGRYICLRLAYEQCKIAVVDINLQEAEQTANDLRGMGATAIAYKVDAANFESIASLRDEIHRDFGRVDILINNVGLIGLLTLMRATQEQIEQMVAVNVTSVMLTTKLFLKDMVQQGEGHIVAISSSFGLTPSSTTVYGTTLFAIRGFMACLNQEILINNWEDKIKTTCAFPFYMATRKELTDYTENLKFV